MLEDTGLPKIDIICKDYFALIDRLGIIDGEAF
jgi:hypothetical protein